MNLGLGAFAAVFLAASVAAAPLAQDASAALAGPPYCGGPWTGAGSCAFTCAAGLRFRVKAASFLPAVGSATVTVVGVCGGVYAYCTDTDPAYAGCAAVSPPALASGPATCVVFGNDHGKLGCDGA